MGPQQGEVTQKPHGSLWFGGCWACLRKLLWSSGLPDSGRAHLLWLPWLPLVRLEGALVLWLELRRHLHQEGFHPAPTRLPWPRVALSPRATPEGCSFSLLFLCCVCLALGPPHPRSLFTVPLLPCLSLPDAPET